jgi:LysR family transcriptional regulator, transcriptional activator for dmlA
MSWLLNDSNMSALWSRLITDQYTIRHPTVAELEMMQIDRPDLALLAAIQREGSLAAAASALDLAPPVASKRLAALEQRVGARLLHRTTRRLQLTAEGETFVAQAAPLLDGFARLEESLAERATQASGRLRVASSFGFGRLWLAPALAALHTQHPGIEIDLHLTEQLPDMTTGRFDAAVWLWRPQGASLVTRRLASNRRIVVAAPSYLKRHGTPRAPDDLLSHQCLVVREHDDSPALWRLQPAASRGGPVRTLRENATRTLRVRGPMTSNHGEVVRDWALAGHGLMLRSLWDVHPHLQRGQLVHVLPDWAMLDADVHLVLPPRDLRLATPRRLRLLQEHLVAAFAEVPWNATNARRAPRPRR